MDADYELPSGLVILITSNVFCSDLQYAVSALKFVAQITTILEQEKFTMSDAYAAFLFVRDKLSTVISLSTAQRCSRISTSEMESFVLPCAPAGLFCDPFYDALRGKAIEAFEIDFVSLGYGVLTQDCIRAFKIISESVEERDSLLGELLRYGVDGSSLVTPLKRYHPSPIWGQLRCEYQGLRNVLVDVFQALASPAGVERNHKVGKRVLSNRCCRMGEASVECQVSISHNMIQLRRVVPSGAQRKLASLFADSMAEVSTGSDATSLFDELLISEENEELPSLLAPILDITNAKEIPYFFLFSE
ncbi:hypothetical protein FGB62_8g20 [Gracilaria domingensis]|nr:hypothetical protein FGB62_8g20 [Gracilaria domingensis]